GLGYGCICPAYQTMFINLAPNNQRGTANSTYLTAWDLGVGLGVLIGGQIAELTDYATAYATSCVLCVVGYLLFKWKTAAHFEKYKLR
ncbi:MAG TPA: MFS transporter, partial [Candidatus Barnesiella excrementavium]|nr:MFS transporter [Candidatus Barnesiella excrementavium]